MEVIRGRYVFTILMPLVSLKPIFKRTYIILLKDRILKKKYIFVQGLNPASKGNFVLKQYISFTIATRWRYNEEA